MNLLLILLNPWFLFLFSLFSLSFLTLLFFSQGHPNFRDVMGGNQHYYVLHDGSLHHLRKVSQRKEKNKGKRGMREKRGSKEREGEREREREE